MIIREYLVGIRKYSLSITEVTNVYLCVVLVVTTVYDKEVCKGI